LPKKRTRKASTSKSNKDVLGEKNVDSKGVLLPLGTERGYLKKPPLEARSKKGKNQRMGRGPRNPLSKRCRRSWRKKASRGKKEELNQVNSDSWARPRIIKGKVPEKIPRGKG